MDNGQAAGGGKKLWSQVVDHLASRNGKVGRAIASDRPADRGKLAAALDAAAAAGVTAGALRRLADEPPLDDPKIRSVSATLAGRIRHHLEDLEHAHG